MQQQGNPMPRFVNNISLGAQLCNGSMNAEGLPNYGIDYYISQDAIAMTNKFGNMLCSYLLHMLPILTDAHTHRQTIHCVNIRIESC